MIFTVTLLSLYLARTGAVLKLHPPLRIVRPLDDIHSNCKQDVGKLCNPIEESNQQNNASFSHPPINRRLSELETEKVNKVVNKKVSLSIGFRIVPKSAKGSIEGAKNNKRFLNYGPKIDTCLWDAFDANQVSMQCASALAYLNDEPENSKFGPSFQYNTSDPNTITKRTHISITVSGFSIVTLILCCIVIKVVYSEENDDTKDETEEENKATITHSTYESILDDPEQISTDIAFVAVPLQVSETSV